jgi:hypothetical protein
VNFEESQVIASAIVGHALPLDIPDPQLSATAGVRYNHVEAELDIDPVLLPRLFPVWSEKGAGLGGPGHRFERSLRD